MGIPRLRPGDLRHVIEVYRSKQVDDGRGAYVDVWEMVTRTRAEAQGQDGREAMIGRALQGINTMRFRIRWRRDAPQAADQIKYGGKDYNIRSVYDPNGEREQFVILADTGSAQATS